MTPRFRPSRIALLALAACASFGALATPTVYFGEDPNAAGNFVTGGNAQTAQQSFFGALQPGWASEGFNGDTFGEGDTASGGLGLWGNTGTLTASSTDTHAQVTGIGCTNFGCTGRFDTTGPSGADTGSTGTSLWWEASQTFSISFGTSASAFGMYVTDLGDFGASLTLQLLDANNNQVGSDLVISPTSTQSGGLLFYGFTDTQQSYAGVRFVINGGNDGIGFDDLQLGNVKPSSGNTVPEPATLALVALSLLGVGVSRRKAAR